MAASEDDQPPLRTCGLARNFYNLMVLSFSFLLLFIGFATAQSFAAPLLGDLGSISLLVLYTFFTGGGLVAPYIVRRLGTTTALVISAATYAAYVASFIYLVTPVLLVTAAMNGLLGNVLWTAHGMKMSEITSEANKGRYFALFVGILSLQLIPGNLVGSYLLDGGGGDGGGGNGTTTTTTTTAAPDALQDLAAGWDDENSPFFVVLTATCVGGVLMLLLFRAPDTRCGSVALPDGRSVAAQAKSTVALLFTTKLGSLVPLFVFCGVHLVGWASWFPRQMYKTKIGLVLPVMAAGALAAGLTIGPAVDRFGPMLVALFAAACSAVALACTWYGNEELVAYCEEHAPNDALPCEAADDYTLFYVAAPFFGAADATFQTLAGTICTKSFAPAGGTDNTADAFALKWALFGVGAMVGFILSVPLSIEGGKTASPDQLRTELIVMAVSMLAAVAGLACFATYFAPVAGAGGAPAEAMAAPGEGGKESGVGKHAGPGARAPDSGGGPASVAASGGGLGVRGTVTV